MRLISKAILTVAALSLFASVPLVAQNARCTQSQITRLEDDSDQLRTWAVVHSYYLKYKACELDDADAEEGYSESVARILVHSWNTFPSGARLMSQDIGFRRFVLSGINVTLLLSDLEAIEKNAKDRCPRGKRRLCGDLIAAVHASDK